MMLITLFELITGGLNSSYSSTDVECSGPKFPVDGMQYIYIYIYCWRSGGTCLGSLIMFRHLSPALLWRHPLYPEHHNNNNAPISWSLRLAQPNAAQLARFSLARAAQCGYHFEFAARAAQCGSAERKLANLFCFCDTCTWRARRK